MINGKYHCGLDCRVGNPDFHCGFHGADIEEVKRNRPHDCQHQARDILESLKDNDGEYIAYKTKW